MGEKGRERAPPTLPRETSEKKRPTASMSASAPIASDFRYSGKKPTARQDSLKVMRPDEGWVCEVEPANETQGPVIRSTLIGKGTPPSTYEGCATLYEIFERSVRLFPDSPQVDVVQGSQREDDPPCFGAPRRRHPPSGQDRRLRGQFPRVVPRHASLQQGQRGLCSSLRYFG